MRVLWLMDGHSIAHWARAYWQASRGYVSVSWLLRTKQIRTTQAADALIDGLLCFSQGPYDVNDEDAEIRIAFDSAFKRDKHLGDSKYSFREGDRVLTYIVTADADKFIRDFVEKLVNRGGSWGKVYVVTEDERLIEDLEKILAGGLSKPVKIEFLKPDPSFMPRTINIMRVMEKGVARVPEAQPRTKSGKYTSRRKWRKRRY